MTKNLFDVEGKVVLVTGSSRGLGLVFARALGEAGALPVLNGRNAERLEETRQKLEAEGLQAAAYHFDVTNEEEVAEAVERIETEVGTIEVLVNNAGLQHRTPLHEFPLEKWRQILEINLTGAFLTAKHTVQRMIPRQRGKVINICSLQSELGRSTIAPYAASKGGLKMLTRGMAVDWAEYNIQVNAIGPGYFKTDMTRALWENKAFDSWLRGRTPADRWGDPAELIGALLFFASAASDFVNGQIIYVDGGISAAI
jgi:gluconate 5-dehydrogenase